MKTLQTLAPLEAYLEASEWVDFDHAELQELIRELQDAQFSQEEEQLAFQVRAECGEVDYMVNHAQPHPKTLETLVLYRDGDCREMYLHHLPDRL